MPVIRDLVMEPTLLTDGADTIDSSEPEAISLGFGDEPFHQPLDQDDNWRCAECWQDEFCWFDNDWMCTVCGSHAFEPKPAVGGRWVFVPNEADPGQEPNPSRIAAAKRSSMTMDAFPSTPSFPMSFSNDPHVRLSAQDHQHDSGLFAPPHNPLLHIKRPWQPSLQYHAKPPSTPPSSSAPSEFAESESRTDDPIVDPYQPVGTPRRRRRRNGNRPERVQAQIPEEIPLNLPGTPLAQATPPRTPNRPSEAVIERNNTPAKTSSSSSSSRSWNS